MCSPAVIAADTHLSSDSTEINRITFGKLVLMRCVFQLVGSISGNIKFHFFISAEGNVTLSALDYSTRAMHLAETVRELETRVQAADPTGDTYAANLLRGENETLRATLAVTQGEYNAVLQDNATLFHLNAKLVRQSNETNARADRMHDQVLSILSEVRELRERLASMCVETRDPSPNYTVCEPEPEIEITPNEQRCHHRRSK